MGSVASATRNTERNAGGFASNKNRPRSIYQYSSMAPRLSGQNCKFFKFLLSLNSQKRLDTKKTTPNIEI